jgi:hypothetical protein
MEMSVACGSVRREERERRKSRISGSRRTGEGANTVPASTIKNIIHFM